MTSNMYKDGHTVKDAPKLPLNLLDALREYEKDEELQVALGNSFSSAYLKLKHAEWNNYCNHFTEWERQTTLDIDEPRTMPRCSASSSILKFPKRPDDSFACVSRLTRGCLSQPLASNISSG